MVSEEERAHSVAEGGDEGLYSVVGESRGIVSDTKPVSDEDFEGVVYADIEDMPSEPELGRIHSPVGDVDNSMLNTTLDSGEEYDTLDRTRKQKRILTGPSISVSPPNIYGRLNKQDTQRGWNEEPSSRHNSNSSDISSPPPCHLSRPAPLPECPLTRVAENEYAEVEYEETNPGAQKAGVGNSTFYNGCDAADSATKERYEYIDLDSVKKPHKSASRSAKSAKSPKPPKLPRPRNSSGDSSHGRDAVHSVPSSLPKPSPRSRKYVRPKVSSSPELPPRPRVLPRVLQSNAVEIPGRSRESNIYAEIPEDSNNNEMPVFGSMADNSPRNIVNVGDRLSHDSSMNAGDISSQISSSSSSSVNPVDRLVSLENFSPVHYYDTSQIRIFSNFLNCS